MKFTIRNTSWVKRRAIPVPERIAISATVPDFKKEHNHFCDMYVTYDDGIEKKFKSRVLQNKITEKWIVDGMHHIVDVTD